MSKQKPEELEVNFHTGGEISKINEEQRLVSGWASVVSVNGSLVVDRQGDVMDIEDLRKAAHDFMRYGRTAGYMHHRDVDGDPIRHGEIVEAMVFDTDIQQALGIDLGKTGMFITVKVYSDDVWAKVKSGELAAFSIGGRGKRVDLDD